VARLGTIVALTAVAALAAVKLLDASDGLDYFWDSGPAIDALVRLDLHDFFAEQPLMGSFSLLVRAPFVAPVFHGDLATVFLAGALPCVAALAALAAALVRRMRERPALEVAAVVVVAVANPLTARALHWGHPEELLAAALAVGGVLAAARGRGLLSGVLLGCAIATKQWALLALVPALLVAGRDFRLLAACAVVVAALTVPLLVGNPDRFMVVVHAASSTSPEHALGVKSAPVFDGARVNPSSVWFPLATRVEADGGPAYLASEWLGRLSHPLILLLGLPLWGAASLRRRRTERDALLLLALVLAGRCALDPMSLDYYHVPLLATLAALAATGGLRETRVALAAATGLSLAFAAPAASRFDLAEQGWPACLAYLAVMLPLAAWLARELYAVPSIQTATSAGSSRTHSASASPV
jgi:hypothetical protein